MQRYLATMCYEHENYVNDIERKNSIKRILCRQYIK